MFDWIAGAEGLITCSNVWGLIALSIAIGDWKAGSTRTEELETVKGIQTRKSKDDGNKPSGVTLANQSTKKSLLLSAPFLTSQVTSELCYIARIARVLSNVSYHLQNNHYSSNRTVLYCCQSF